jgi:protein-tyrosine-phosphatase
VSRTPPFLRRLRAAPRRLVHALRRRQAREALRHRSRPPTVLVVCYGNICRSPFAAGLLAAELGAVGVQVESAGFASPNRPCPPEAVTVAARRGVDLSAHRSTLLTPGQARSADLIVVMDPAHGRVICDRFGRLPRDILVLGDLDPEPLATPAIRDPVNQDVAVFEEAYARIERCVSELSQALCCQPATVSS